ncbi:MAG: hypothetical protein LBU60_05215 [Clostridiales bacterium]|jgi:hypothetical protein|nr:hypothetical protein [Clostridiales bacterium]
MREKVRATYVTRKVFNNEVEKLSIKEGYQLNHAAAKRARERYKRIKEQEYANLYNLDMLARQKELERLEFKYMPKLSSAVRSMSRAKNNLIDIMRCNKFDYFVTLTFDKEKIDRLDDTAVRRAYRKWRDNIKKQFGHMYYVAVEEYHKKGGLHYHLLIGSVDKNQLGLVDSGNTITKGRTAGQPIYNITRWRNGFSTATELLDKTAAMYYIAKYLTKNAVDPRFFNKKRYFTSQNVNRPSVERTQHIDTDRQSDFDIFDSIMIELYDIEYGDVNHDYTVLSRSLTDESSQELIEERKKLADEYLANRKQMRIDKEKSYVLRQFERHSSKNIRDKYRYDASNSEKYNKVMSIFFNDKVLTQSEVLEQLNQRRMKSIQSDNTLLLRTNRDFFTCKSMTDEVTNETRFLSSEEYALEKLKKEFLQLEEWGL